MPNIVLYGMDISPPVRACLLTLHALDLPFEYKDINLIAGEHRTEEYLKKNPQHTVPLLEDDGALIWDSHAIVCYLVDKYAATDELYPKDLLKRAAVNQRLYFEASVLFMPLRSISKAYFYHQISEVPREKLEDVRDGYNHLETFLGDNPHVTGDSLTVADFCCAATITSLVGILELDPLKYPKITAWLELISQLPYYEEANGVGAKKYSGLLKAAALTFV